MKKARHVVLGAALLVVAPALAQKSPTVGQVSYWKATPGSEAAWAEGRKQHMEFHRQQKDTFGWQTWEITNGDRAGGFLTGTFGHHWKDFDGREAFDALDAADVAKTFGPVTESNSTGFWIYLESASREPAGATGPAKFSQLTHYFVRPADVPRFEDALEAIKAELDKASYPVYSSWYRLASGGEGPHYVLSTRRDSYAAFAPPEKTVMQVVSDALGARKAGDLFETLRTSTERFYTEILQHRPDLSYVPAAK